VGNQRIILSIKGHRADTGSLMGKDCQHKDAMINLVKLMTGRQDVRLSIGEGHKGERAPLRDIPLRDTWSEEDDALLQQAIRSITALLFSPGEAPLRIQSAGKDTLVTIFVPRPTPPEIQEAFHHIFRAWGRHHGRRISVEIGQPNESRTA
jgi:hypothetical protein